MNGQRYQKKEEESVVASSDAIVHLFKMEKCSHVVWQRKSWK